MTETIQSIPLDELHDFPDHPFAVRDDDAMQQTVESIKEYGVLVPAIARPREEGGYEIIAGHRRKHACELAGLKTMPVIVRDLDRNAATIIMVDSNLQRENILPSERAKAYKMKLDAIKRQGARHDLTCDQVGHKLDGAKSVQRIADEAGASKTHVQPHQTPARLLRLRCCGFIAATLFSMRIFRQATGNSTSCPLVACPTRKGGFYEPESSKTA